MCTPALLKPLSPPTTPGGVAGAIIGTATTGSPIAGQRAGEAIEGELKKKGQTPQLPPQEPAGSTTPPTTTDATRTGIRSRISDEQRRRLGLKGRRSTILTGAAGLTEPATTRPKFLLGV